MAKIFYQTEVGLSVWIIFLFLLSPFRSSSQLLLPDKLLPVNSDEFFIAGVEDNRTEKEAVGRLVFFVAGKPVIRPYDLKGGAASAVNTYFKRNLKLNSKGRPVIISINELSISENPGQDQQAEGRLRLSVSFHLQKNYGLLHLTDYRGSLQYKRNVASDASLEYYLSEILNASIVHFDEWMNDNVKTNPSLAAKVALLFSDYQEKDEGDTIYYSPARPLKWDDFQSRIRPGANFMAQVIPGIGYTQEASMANGTIEVVIALKTYLPKSSSRAVFDGRDAYALNHEQRHFDIAKIITDQFRQKLINQVLTPESYEAAINMQYLDSYRDLDAMQKAYDKETKHGSNREVQSEWNTRIYSMLAEDKSGL